MRVPPPILALAAAAGQRALTRDASPATPLRRTVAAGGAAVTVGLVGWANVVFRASGTTIDPTRPERATSLVTSGPFAYTRNPMYVGLASALVGHAVLRGSPKALLPLAAFVTVIDQTQIAAEEIAMASLFGAEYDAYRERVPRWIGPR